MAERKTVAVYGRDIVLFIEERDSGFRSETKCPYCKKKYRKLCQETREKSEDGLFKILKKHFENVHKTKLG